MRIAITGKGGVGKTTLAALLCRRLAQKGYPVLAIDADPDPHLGLSLGIAPQKLAQQPTLVGKGGLVPTRQEQFRKFVHQLACRSSEGIPLLLLHRAVQADAGCFCRGYQSVYALLEMLGYWQRWFVVVDVSGGMEILHRKSIRHVDVVLIVTEPSRQSLETALRIYHGCGELNIPHRYVLANKIRDTADRTFVEAAFAGQNVDLLAKFPYTHLWRNVMPPPISPVDEVWEPMEKLTAQLDNDYRTRLLCDAAFEISEKFLLVGKSRFNQREQMALRHLAQTGGMTMKQLSHSLRSAFSTTTAIVDKMETFGYVRRSPDIRDRRVVRVSLTERGEDLYRNHVAKYEEILKSGIRHLDEKEQNTLLQLVSKVLQTERD